MAPSQLKRLKSSLREQGITGPQKSKKQKKQNAQNAKESQEKRLRKSVALGNIREQFNPFDLKHSRGPKFEVTTTKLTTKGILGRPGVTKAAGEQKRQETLLVEMQRRNKVGGIIDRRIGEYDANMAEETKMLERFVAEKQRSHRKSSIFDLEDEEPVSALNLTHNGQALTFDDFDNAELSDIGSDVSVDERKQIKRQRFLEALQAEQNEEPEEDSPKVKKTKKEVMEEIIAKSKAYKYERQQIKDEDQEIIDELNKETHDILSELLNSKAKKDKEPKGVQTVAGMERADFEKQFDKSAREMAEDIRAKPAEKTKTEEELAVEKVEKLKELEEKRVKRMNGEPVSSDSEPEDGKAPATGGDMDIDLEEEDFGLGSGIKTLKKKPSAADLGFDDEDDFVIDDDLVASSSDFGNSDSEEEEEEDDEFGKELKLTTRELQNPEFTASGGKTRTGNDESGLPYTFPCPTNIEEFLAIVTVHPLDKIATIVQRIRALYHPSLEDGNKDKLGVFVEVLIDFVANSNEFEGVPFASIEAVSRHIHSMAKMFPTNVANKCRIYLSNITFDRPLAFTTGDLTLLLVIGTVFPTSDHFHQVVTPAMLVMGRYLGQKVPIKLTDYVTGAFLCTLIIQFQKFSKRFFPEVLSFIQNSLLSLAPKKPSIIPGFFPIHEPAAGIRISKASNTTLRKLKLSDCDPKIAAPDTILQVSLLATFSHLIDAATDLWTSKASSAESFTPISTLIAHLLSKSSRPHFPAPLITILTATSTKLSRHITLATTSRQPLELHHHRPLAIKMSFPKFEDQFNPTKHYDPNKDRVELAKLQKEYKKERKGALRELRKDAQFMQREKLRVKKAKDEAYEKKFKRLVAEIQGEEGAAANEYEREKSARVRARQRGR